jgi:hypothetical protein
MQKTFVKPIDSESDSDNISSTIKQIKYDTETKVLSVDFHNGKQYEYLDVPSEVAEKALTVESIGSFLIAKVFKNYSSKQIK